MTPIELRLQPTDQGRKQMQIRDAISVVHGRDLAQEDAAPGHGRIMTGEATRAQASSPPHSPH